MVAPTTVSGELKSVRGEKANVTFSLLFFLFLIYMTFLYSLTLLFFTSSWCFVLFHDDFSNITFSSNSWLVDKQCLEADVIFLNGTVAIKNRALLVTKKSWNPATGNKCTFLRFF